MQWCGGLDRIRLGSRGVPVGRASAHAVRGACATMSAARDLVGELHGASATLDELVDQGAERAPTLAKLCIEMTGRLTRLPKSDDTITMCDELSAAITDGPWTDRMRDAMTAIVDARAAAAAPTSDAKPFQHCERWTVHQPTPLYTNIHCVAHSGSFHSEYPSLV